MNTSKKLLTGLLCVGLLGSGAQSQSYSKELKSWASNYSENKRWKNLTFGTGVISTISTVFCAGVAGLFALAAKGMADRGEPIYAEDTIAAGFGVVAIGSLCGAIASWTTYKQ